MSPSTVTRPTFATQSDIAQRAKVSLMTVQRALSGHPHVAEKTRQRIEETARKIGYRPNAAARSTRTGRTGCFALLLSSVSSRSIIPSGTLHGIQSTIRQHDLHLLLEELPDAKLTDEGFVPKILRQLMSDGLLINYNAQIPDKMIELIGRSALPCVWLNSQQDADCVYPDDIAAADDLTRHLIELGHRRIAYVDHTHSIEEKPWHYSGLERYDGYVRTMQAAGLTPRRLGSREQFHTGEAVDAAVATLRADDRPTAVIAYVARGARIMATAARIAGLRVPEDLSIAVFENRVNRESGVTLTTMKLPDEQVGRLGTEMLIQKVEGDTEPMPSRAVPFRFAQGESTVPPSTPTAS